MEAKYQRIKIIGKGSFGKAFLVRNTEADTLCVVKQMDTGMMDTKERNEAVKEALVLKKLAHPNIIQFQEVFMTRKGRLCIVMDYADGGDLHTAIQKQKGVLLPEEKIVEWFVQICFALLHVHDRKVLHRDLKTHNIFLMASGQIKLGDFGIARVLETMQGYAKTMVGTPYYLSPEIIQERPYAYKSDVWSCGIVLYEMATLKHPFDADSLVILAGKIVRDEIPDLDSMYSSDLQALVQDMLKKDENKRPSFRQILRRKFLLAPMNESNEKFSLGLDLSEFAEGAGAEEEEDGEAGEGRPGTTGTVGCGSIEDYSGDSEGEEADGPTSMLSRSVAELRLAEEQDAGKGVGKKAEALRSYLVGQTSEERFQQAHELVRAATRGGAGVAPDAAETAAEELRRAMGEVIGAEEATVLLPMFQLLCFLEDISASVLKESIVEKFRKWDVNGDGVISPQELQTVLRNLGMEDEIIISTFSAMDANEDGKIDYREFVDWLYSGLHPTESPNEAV
mmetsp:Transcript_113065/g.314687  ORF Transcript_113065/g.314687 Transcript_113065/m.314687 type:complete len:508 (+) Transcript_113065:75-1598(+)|eukprot:CAMPEP_0179020380 /NCGR_PEP_ID=MMETSP0796-20121207/5349_1 /TAXON_ID=73915 /ORGANISM="Pyrodinium bahamense, Strain pbaha01" /LENGTH=507 /DNA_ID=CAMNT_0020716187 /DNA_START=75 /DNA_END=1598 /DNA_ORIENTATION=-